MYFGGWIETKGVAGCIELCGGGKALVPGLGGDVLGLGGRINLQNKHIYLEIEVDLSALFLMDF